MGKECCLVKACELYCKTDVRLPKPPAPNYSSLPVCLIPKGSIWCFIYISFVNCVITHLE